MIIQIDTIVSAILPLLLSLSLLSIRLTKRGSDTISDHLKLYCICKEDDNPPNTHTKINKSSPLNSRISSMNIGTFPRTSYDEALLVEEHQADISSTQEQDVVADANANIVSLYL